MRLAEITFVVLTKDEERCLPRALASIPPGARVLVVDAQSSDATVAIARGAGAQVLIRPWEGFVAARRFAAAQVRTPWAFMLDADETLDEALREALLAAEPGERTAGFTVSRTTYLCGRPVTGAGWGGEILLRLFRVDRARLEAHPAAGGPADLHERWNVDGEVLPLAGALLHDSYPTLAAYWKKFDRYTSIEAASRALSLRVVRAVLVAPARCLWLFVGRGGYRDGWRGAFVAFGSALYPLAVACKALFRESEPRRD